MHLFQNILEAHFGEDKLLKGEFVDQNQTQERWYMQYINMFLWNETLHEILGHAKRSAHKF